MTGADAFVLAPIMDPEAAEREEAPREKKDKVSGSANWVARRVARRRLRAAGGNTHSRFDDQDRFGRSAPEAVEVGGLSLRRRVPWQPGPDGTTCSPALGRTDTLLVPCPRLRVFFFFWQLAVGIAKVENRILGELQGWKTQQAEAAALCPDPEASP